MLSIPDLDDVIFAYGEDTVAIGRPFHDAHPVGVTTISSKRVTFSDFPHLYRLILT